MSPTISQTACFNSFRQNLREIGINLKDGQIIRATVLGKLPGGNTLLSINGRQLNVPTQLNLPEGSKLMLQVTLTGSKVDLIPVENSSLKPDILTPSMPATTAKEITPGILSELKSALDQGGLNNIAAQGAKDLRQIMSSIQYSDPGKNNGPWIKENILAGGMLWENKVAEFLSDENNLSIKKLMKGDLKAILLSLRKALETEDGSQSDAAALKVKQALSLIENTQLHNLAALEDGLGWLFFIPGLAIDGFNKAEIFLKKRDASNGTSFSVLAEFTRLGRFEARVTMMDSMASIRILTDDKEKAEIVNGSLSLLEAGIKALGLNNVALSCDVRKATDVPGEVPGIFFGRSKAVDLVI
jgi:hypothetical protein